MADSGDQLLREIDEDLRREQWLKLWRAYGRYVATVTIVLVICVVAFLGWREWRQRQLAGDSHAYWLADRLTILGDWNGAAAGFGELADDGHGGYPLLARLREAEALAEAGKTDEAVAAYDAVAADTSLDVPYRQLGSLYAAMVMLDAGDPAQISSRIDPIAESASPWRHTAIELQGLLAMRTGESARAATLFQGLIDDSTTPTTLRARAAQLLALTGGAS